MSYTFLKNNLEELKAKEFTDETKNEIIDYIIKIMDLLESNDKAHSQIVEVLQRQVESITLIKDALKD